MEINIKVTVELPAWAEAIANAIVANGGLRIGAQTDAPATDEKPAVEEKPAAKKTTKKAAAKQAPSVEAPATQAPADEAPADEAPANEKEGHSLEELRALLPQKLEGNQKAIRAKLSEFGAVSLSKLDPKYYDPMYDYLNSL